MKKKRITFAILTEKDEVRHLEMLVDRVATNPGISIQFWSDVRLYGVDEAVTYLRRYCPSADYTELDSLVSRIRDAMPIQSHAEAAKIFRDTFGSEAEISWERLISIVGEEWAWKMRAAGTIVTKKDLFSLGRL